MAECIVKGCGKTLKTGRKFCHIHRGFSGLPKEKPVVETKVKRRVSVTEALIRATLGTGTILSIIGFGVGGIFMGLFFMVMTGFAIWAIIKVEKKQKEKRRELPIERWK